MACEGLRQQLAGLRDLELQTQADARDATGIARTRLLQELKQIRANIAAVQRNLAACMATPPRLPAKAAEQILSLVYENPAFGGTDDWAKPIAGGAFPKDPGGFEWKQVLAPGNEQEDNLTLVGASGWMLGPNIAGSDFFFSHPFGSDWECLMALDQPPDNPSKYTFLLAPGNAQAAPPAGQQPKDTTRARDFAAATASAAALSIPVPNGMFLDVEMDWQLVPSDFQHNVVDGDRVAMLGRWIVDCGHDNHGAMENTYHAEIHPPLLMACAHVENNATRVMFTSRPYLVSEEFSTDTNAIYDDSNGDGTFYDHLIKEVAKCAEVYNPVAWVLGDASTQVEAHPKIKTHPFRGTHVAQFLVKPPPLGGRGAIAGGALAPRPVNVTFHFTVRSGCAVQLIWRDPDTVAVVVVMNEFGYNPPHLPTRHDRTISKQELIDAGHGGEVVNAEELVAAIGLISPGSVVAIATAEAILQRGIVTDQYDPLPDVTFFDPAQSVTASAENIPGGIGISVDDSQPYPIVGWLEVAYGELTSKAEPDTSAVTGLATPRRASRNYLTMS